MIRGLAGFRGAVSLAAALGVPTIVGSGAAFPGRDLIVFVTAGVIVVTLLGQGLLLPVLVRRIGFPPDPDGIAGRRSAELQATGEALAHLDEEAAAVGTGDTAIAAVRDQYRETVEGLQRGLEADVTVEEQQILELRLALLRRRRATVIRMHDSRRIDDETLRVLQRRLDIEELRLTDR